MPERKPLTTRGKVLAVLTVFVMVVFSFIALVGREKVGLFFQGRLRYFWIAVILGIGYFATHDRGRR
jgi:hypothetical protein